MLHGHCNLHCPNGTGILREFRDKYLLTHPVGQVLVGLYYRVGPPMAQFITEYPRLKSIVRAGLLPALVISTIVSTLVRSRRPL